MRSDSQRLVQNMVDALNAQDLDGVLRYYSPAYTGLDLSLASRYQGTDDLAQALAHSFQAFPDAHMQIHHINTRADQVVVLWSLTGTHEGPFAQIPPTGKMTQASGMSLFYLQEGHIHRGLHVWDLAGLLRTMGLLPELPGGYGLSQTALLSAFFASSEAVLATPPLS